MESSTTFLAVAFISLIAAISPGPDFFIVFRNSLVYSRKAGIMTTFGISAAIIIHLTYTLVGIGVLIAEDPFLFALVKYSGVAYLLYIGLKGIIASFKPAPFVALECSKASNQIAPSAAFMQGFWTNLLNPKAAIFFISLFSQLIDASTPMLIAVAYGAINWSIALGWFILLSCLLTHQKVVGRIDRYRAYVDRVMGGVLMMLDFKMLLA